jgi:prepilin-type N-terminal cleavage/methylation domain-containing protein
MTRIRTAGFTLIEVVVGLSLVAALFVGVAALFVASARAVSSARAATIGGLLAREKMEQLRALPFDDPALLAFGVDTLREDFDGYNDAPVAGYRRRWSIGSLPAHSDQAIVVEVDVLNADGAVVARLVAIRARRGV